MADDLTVTVAFLKPLFQYIKAKGIDQETVCKMANINISKLSSAENRITIDEANKITSSIILLSGDKNIGFNIGRSYSIGNAGIVGHVMMNCPTIGDAWKKYCSFQELVGNIVRIKLITGKNLSGFQWECNPEIVQHSALIYEILTSAVVNTTKELCGKDIPLQEVHFSYPKPENYMEYKKIFKCNIIFNEDETAIFFESKYLDIPLKNPDTKLLSLMESYAADYLKNFHKKDTLSSRVQRLLKVYHGIIPRIDKIAAELGLSVRNLQIKLKDEGFTFRILREIVQRELAEKYIKNSNYTINEISHMLGYSEPCIFRKTFKRWTGLPPGKYRKSEIR